MRMPVMLWRSGIFRVLGAALLWLIVISSLHYALNSERSAVPDKVVMGYMPVVTNLAAPLVDLASRDDDVHFQALKLASFAEMAEAFRAGHIQVAFIIAPLAIRLFQQGVPLKVVYIGNRHESTLVVRKDCPARSLADLAGRSIAVPIRYSGHYLAIRKHLREQGLRPDAIKIIEIPPPDMPAALAAGGIDGYFVGEPFASKTLQNGLSRRLLDVESIWPRFICNLMIVHEELIRKHPQWVQTLVTAAVRSGLYARDHLEEVEQVLCSYWGQERTLVSFTFSSQPGRFQYDLYLPVQDELDEMAEEMLKTGFIDRLDDLKGLVDDGFARRASTETVRSLREIVVR